MGKVQVSTIPKKFVDLSKLVIVIEDIYEWANSTFLLHIIAVRNRKGKTLLLFGSLKKEI